MKLDIMGHEVELHQYWCNTMVDQIEVIEVTVDGYDVTNSTATGVDKSELSEVVNDVDIDDFLEELWLYVD